MDIAKGIGIICVLLGHTYANEVCMLVNTFHMPLFFIISGFFFVPKEKMEIKNCLKLLIPYCITIAAFVLFSLLKREYGNATLWIRGGVYGSGYEYETPFFIKGVGGIWFLLAMLWVKSIANKIFKFDEKYWMLLAILTTYVGVKTYHCFVFPWSVQCGMTASLFFVLGYYLRKDDLLKHLNFLVSVIFFIIWFYCYKYYGTLTMANCNIPNIMTVIGALCGSAVILYVSKIFERVFWVNNVLEYIGKMTLIILCVHIFELHTNILADIQNLLYKKTYNLFHIFFLRCIFDIGVASIIKKLITLVEGKQLNGNHT